MENIILANIATLSGLAVVAAIILYFVAKRFRTESNPLVEEINQILPQANCGACGKAGCQAFAEACAVATADDFRELYCPVGGKSVMDAIADKLGYISQEKEATVAVLHCQGTCQNAPDKIEYLGLKSCRLASRVFVGRTGCPNGCLRFGDCAAICPFGAISIDEKTCLPKVDAEKCTSCGNCVKICPRGLYKILPRGENDERVYVACSNKQKGAIARKNCKAACIACMKCTKICPDVTVSDNLSHIPTDVSIKQYGKELATACPTGAIVYTGDKND